MKAVAPTVILLVLLSVGYTVLRNPPEAPRRGAPSGPQTVVETMTVLASPYQIHIASYGTVQPRTQSMLVAQVGGQIVDVQPGFRPGQFFSADDTLITIDPRDYEADVKIAEAALMDAIQAQAQEAARAEQALTDWQRLGGANEQPTALVLRQPQLQAAEARVRSSQAALTKAQLDLARASVTAPFSGRILRQLVDLGQVVNQGTPLAEVYATDSVEIRLPIRHADLPFVDLPEADDAYQPPVLISSDLGGEQTWPAKIIRTEGAIDEVARQLHVVAEVNEPFQASGGRRPLKIGEYVTAEISGKLLADAVVIPADTVYQNSYVYVIAHHADMPVLQRRSVKIAWQNGRDVIIQAGVQAQDTLVTTPLGQLTSGTPVRLAASDEQQAQGRSLEGVAQ